MSCIINNSENLINGAEGRKSIKLVNAMYESAEKGVPIIMSQSAGSSKFGISEK